MTLAAYERQRPRHLALYECTLVGGIRVHKIRDSKIDRSGLELIKTQGLGLVRVRVTGRVRVRVRFS